MKSNKNLGQQTNVTEQGENTNQKSCGEVQDCRRFKVVESNPPLRRKIIEDKQ